MSATREHIKSECKKVFAAIPLLDSLDKVGKGEIVDALLTNCQNNDHVTTVLRTFQKTVSDWRNPIAELVRIARETEKSDQPPAGCERCCLGPDVFSGEMRWAPHVSVSRGDYDYAERCPGTPGNPCPRGEWLKARDVERRGVAPERHALDHVDRKTAAGGDE